MYAVSCHYTLSSYIKKIGLWVNSDGTGGQTIVRRKTEQWACAAVRFRPTRRTLPIAEVVAAVAAVTVASNRAAQLFAKADFYENRWHEVPAVLVASQPQRLK